MEAGAPEADAEEDEKDEDVDADVEDGVCDIVAMAFPPCPVQGSGNA